MTGLIAPPPGEWHRLRVPLWLRIAMYAEAMAGEDGAVDLEPWQLLKTMDPQMIMHPSQISRAIRTAEAKGFLVRGSSARRLLTRPPSPHTAGPPTGTTPPGGVRPTPPLELW